MIRSLARPVAASLVAAALLAGTGCIVISGTRVYSTDPVAERYYTDDDGMDAVVQANKRVRLGMSRDEAIAHYPPEFATLMSSAEINDQHIEEWRVQAFRGSSRRIKSRFVRWLYFADGRLVRMSPDRVNLSVIPEDYPADPIQAIPDESAG